MSETKSVVIMLCLIINSASVFYLAHMLRLLAEVVGKVCR